MYKKHSSIANFCVLCLTRLLYYVLSIQVQCTIIIIMMIQITSVVSACLLLQEKMAKKSHHFKGLQQYEDKLMDLAEGKPAFSGRGQKPSNKQVIAAIASIKKCQQLGLFLHFLFIFQAMLLHLWLAPERCCQEEGKALSLVG